MAIQHNTDPLESVVERIRVALRKPPTSVLHRTPIVVGDHELVIRREDLALLVDAATWRLGYLQGKAAGEG